MSEVTYPVTPTGHVVSVGIDHVVCSCGHNIKMDPLEPATSEANVQAKEGPAMQASTRTEFEGTCANCGCEAHYMLMDAAAEALSAPAKATTSSTTAKASA